MVLKRLRPNNISIIDIHTNNSRSSSVSDAPQVSISPEAHSKLGRHLNSIMSVKPILPKPPTNNLAPTSNHVGNPTPLYPSGMGPQGPTVSINHIIAAHRRENPNVPPISETSVLSRGAKRGAWRHKYEGEKRGSPREPDRPSSVSSSNNETDLRLNSSLNPKAHLSNVNNNSPLTMNDSIVSYKDVLLQFAQLTQTEKSPGSPQISIIPVSSSDTPSRKFEHTPDSTSVSRELSIPPQASNQSPSLEGSSALAKKNDLDFQFVIVNSCIIWFMLKCFKYFLNKKNRSHFHRFRERKKSNHAILKLLLESGAGNHGSGAKNSAVDLSSYGSSPDSLTLSALLSGGTMTTHKDKPSSGSQSCMVFKNIVNYSSLNFVD
ncbi:hypothetical protein Anas_02256 [Armadillidium nasatum]|uniref:Uncharacterized protein n=1 Tax=Armadillidium nasatum TaxID=96803 RepID=A0A5N5SQG1_9CRUS|nr:hypothetical protein Anas_02256 [Armadillidium nasatum]